MYLVLIIDHKVLTIINELDYEWTCYKYFNLS